MSSAKEATKMTIETLTAAVDATTEAVANKNSNFAAAVRADAVADAIGDDITAAAVIIDPLTDKWGYPVAGMAGYDMTRALLASLVDGLKVARRRIAEQAEQARIAAGGIRQHPAAKATGLAHLNERIQFRGGKRGVVLHSRDETVIGYPIPLDDGAYLVAAKFGKHRYHEDAPPMYVALGRITDEAGARRALRKHGPTLREELAMDSVAGGQIPAGAARIAGTGPHAADYARHTWLVDADGHLIEAWNEYDFGPRARRSTTPVTAVQAALIVGVQKDAIAAAWETTVG